MTPARRYWRGGVILSQEARHNPIDRRRVAGEAFLVFQNKKVRHWPGLVSSSSEEDERPVPVLSSRSFRDRASTSQSKSSRRVPCFHEAIASRAVMDVSMDAWPVPARSVRDAKEHQDLNTDLVTLTQDGKIPRAEKEICRPSSLVAFSSSRHRPSCQVVTAGMFATELLFPAPCWDYQRHGGNVEYLRDVSAWRETNVLGGVLKPASLTPFCDCFDLHRWPLLLKAVAGVGRPGEAAMCVLSSANDWAPFCLAGARLATLSGSRLTFTLMKLTNATVSRNGRGIGDPYAGQATDLRTES